MHSAKTKSHWFWGIIFGFLYESTFTSYVRFEMREVNRIVMMMCEVRCLEFVC